MVAMGASTGGPQALQAILSRLPGHFPLPIAIVQHMSPGFIEGFAQWLRTTCPLPVQVAAAGMHLSPGQVYLAPDGRHLRINAQGTIDLVQPAFTNNSICPSVAVLFQSVAEVFGGRAIGVLLAGMGKDGAEQLKLIKERGGVTVAQDQESSVVHGMAGEAVRLGAVDYQLPPEEIAAALIDWAGASPRRQGEQR